MARVINKEERLLHKCCQELVDSTFAYLHAYKGGTDFQKATTRKKLVSKIDQASEFFEGKKVVQMPKPKKVISYRTESKVVHIIGKG